MASLRVLIASIKRTDGVSHVTKCWRSPRITVQTHPALSCKEYTHMTQSTWKAPEQKILTQQFIQKASFFDEVDPEKIPKEVDGKGSLVYVGTMAKMVKFVKTFSVSTSMIGLVAQPYLFFHADSIPLSMRIAMGGMLGFCVFVTPLLIHWVTGRYVTKMYYDFDKELFTATRYSLIVREKDMRFGVEDVVVPDIPGLLTTIKANNKSLFIDPSLFLSKTAYFKLMGFDKPLDLTIDASAEDKKTE